MARLLTFGVAAALLISLAFGARPVNVKSGPCTTPVPAITITITTVDDLAQRLQYPNNTMVTMVLTGNLTLSGTFNFNSSFSCTLFSADPALQGQMPFLIYPKDDQIAVRMTDLLNFYLQGIGIWHEYNVITSAGCDFYKYKIPEYSNRWICPGVYIYHSYNVFITQSYIHGRIDVLRSGAVDLSYNYIEHNFTNYQPTGFYSLCVIRFMLCGDQTNLIRSLNKLTNNEIVGGSSAVLNYFGAVGIIVQNNYIHGFSFAGLQCGMGDSNIVDCMLNTFEMNYIESPPNLQSDGTGIYYGTHWFNPGNRDSCNYVVGGSHCYYLDYTSTGLNIEGAVCLRNHDGFKINTGKLNRIASAIIVDPQYQAALLSCQNWCDNNCAAISKAYAKTWWTQFSASYSTTPWKAAYPLLQTFCTTTQYSGVPCNPDPQQTIPTFTAYCSQFLQTGSDGKQLNANATVTGNCSGIPALNDIELIIVNPFKVTRFPLWPPYFINCEALPSVTKNNDLGYQRFNHSFLGFNDEANDDYGADDPSAPIYQYYPNFYSCPRSVVGIQAAVTAKVRRKSALDTKFNRPAPNWFWNTYKIFPKYTDGTAGGGRVNKPKGRKTTSTGY